MLLWMTVNCAVWVIVLVFTFGRQCACQTGEDVDRLVSHINSHLKYTSHIRPVRNQREITMANTSMGIHWIDSFDVTNGHAIVAGHLLISWMDEYLVWDPSEYGGLSRLFLPDDIVWKPNIFDLLSENDILQTDKSGLLVTNFGQVSYSNGGHFRASCKIDLYNMPLDNHKCFTVFMPAILSNFQLNFGFLDVSKKDYVEHQEWRLLELNSEISSMSVGTIIAMTTEYIQFNFELHRRPKDMMMYTILPYFFTVSLNLFSCMIPVDSGERVSFSLTLFLSFIVVASNISGGLPSSANKVTLFSIFSTVFHILNTINVAWSVVVTTIARFTEDKSIPAALKFINLHIKRIESGEKTFTASRQENTDGHESMADLHVDNQLTGQLHNDSVNLSRETTVELPNHAKPSKTHDEDDVSWMEVADSLDTLHFFINILLLTVSCLIYLILVLSY